MCRWLSHGQLITNMKTVLYRTTAKCATQCTAKIFFARIANQQPHLPCSQPDQSAPTPTTNVGAKHFSPKSQPATPHTCSQPDPSAPTPPTNVRAKNISPESQPATPHTCSQPDPSAPTSSANVRAKGISPLQHTTDPPYPGNDPTKVPHTASHRRRAMCWGCAAAPAATPLSCQINLNHNWR